MRTDTRVRTRRAKTATPKDLDRRRFETQLRQLERDFKRLGPSGGVHYWSALRIELGAKTIRDALAVFALIPSWEGSAAFTGLSLAAMSLATLAGKHVKLLEKEGELRQELVDQMQAAWTALDQLRPQAAKGRSARTRQPPARSSPKARSASRPKRATKLRTR